MAMYFSMIANNGEIVLDRIRWLSGDIWSKILEEKGQELDEKYNEMKFYTDYHIDIQDIPRIIDYYEKLIDGKYDDGYGMISVIRYKVIPNLKKQIEYQLSEHRDYIIRWD